MTAFDDAAADLAAALEAERGETFTLHPRAAADVNARSSGDATRQPAIFVGCFTDEAARAGSDTATTGRGIVSEPAARASTRPVVACRLSQFQERPRKGDHVIRARDGSRWRIAELRPSWPGWVHIDLNLI